MSMLLIFYQYLYNLRLLSKFVLFGSGSGIESTIREG